MESVHTTVNGQLAALYGDGWETSRAAIETAATRGNRIDVYRQIGHNPAAFGPVTGDPRRATQVGDALGVRDDIASRLGLPPGDPAVRAVAGREQDGPIPERVKQAIDSVRLLLHVPLTELLNPVSKHEMEQVEAVLYQLGPAETTQAIGLLGDDELHDWIKHTHHVIGGYSDVERETMFSRLAVKLDAPQLRRLAGALATPDIILGGNRDAELLGFAIGEHARPAVVQAFVQESLGMFHADPASRRDTQLTTITAEAVGGLRRDPASVANALSGFDSADMDALLAAGTRSQTATLFGAQGMGADARVYRAETTYRMLWAISETNDVGLKTEAFASAATLLGSPALDQPASDGVTAQPAIESIRRGMSALLQNQTNEVVTRLRTDTDVQGVSLTTYLEAMVAAGDTDAMMGHINRLKFGDDWESNGDRLESIQLERFEHVGNDPVTGTPERGIARDVGYYLGASYNAFANRLAANQVSDDALGRFFSGVAGIPDPRLQAGSAFAKEVAAQISDGREQNLEAAQGEFRNVGYPPRVNQYGRAVVYRGPGADELETSFREALTPRSSTPSPAVPSVP